MNLFGCQFDIAWEDKSANFAKVRRLVGAIRPPRGSLVVLPEMFSTGFSMDASRTRQGSKPECDHFLAELTREHGVYVVAGVVNTGSDGKARNEAVAFTPGGQLIARYTKMQPFSLAGETEAYPGGDAIVTFEWQGFTVAPFICYDLRFPELFRAAVRRGANVLLVIANWPVKRERHWLTLLQARAIENQAYVVGVNRCGQDPQFTYNGRSVVVDPHGVIVTDAGEQERILMAKLEVEIVQSWRKDFPALRDARWMAGV
jgi:predicted amidohydrolase